MRTLTIKRIKSFVGSLSAIKVYIEDPEHNELTIDGVPCRRLGEIKNGAEQTFTIGEEAVKILAIAGERSVSLCSDCYQLPAGTEAVSLSGKCELNPATGNAFRFENNPTEGISEQHKRSSRKGKVILAISLAAGILIGLLVSSKLRAPKKHEPKTFTKAGISITLTDEFREAQSDDFTAVFETKDSAAFALREGFDTMEGLEDWTLEQYSDIIIKANGLDDEAETRTENGLTGFEYERKHPRTNEVFKYYSYVYKTDDAFWLVQFSTPEQNAEKMRAQVEEWARSVSFTK